MSRACLRAGTWSRRPTATWAGTSQRTWCRRRRRRSCTRPSRRRCRRLSAISTACRSWGCRPPSAPIATCPRGRKAARASAKSIASSCRASASSRPRCHSTAAASGMAAGQAAGASRATGRAPAASTAAGASYRREAAGPARMFPCSPTAAETWTWTAPQTWARRTWAAPQTSGRRRRASARRETSRCGRRSGRTGGRRPATERASEVQLAQISSGLSLWPIRPRREEGQRPRTEEGLATAAGAATSWTWPTASRR
mmetsp:Transcript_41437/g.125203  ORF Transcript_41437/g.125203 Transcript_41437/m.125203 type:complete len:256 (-) Transcript_41437:597-1364(-)